MQRCNLLGLVWCIKQEHLSFGVGAFFVSSGAVSSSVKRQVGYIIDFVDLLEPYPKKTFLVHEEKQQPYAGASLLSVGYCMKSLKKNDLRRICTTNNRVLR
jgi:hypothetical protein